MSLLLNIRKSVLVAQAVSLFLFLLLAPSVADAPVVTWRLVPTGFRSVSLCLNECELKAGFVAGYEWAAGGTAQCNSRDKHHDIAVNEIWHAMLAAIDAAISGTER